jgi:hypothetical protein
MQWLSIASQKSHDYRGKESVMHLFGEMDTWLERYVKRTQGNSTEYKSGFEELKRWD